MSKLNLLHAWFGLPETGPLDFYNLLGVPQFESRLEIIQAGYDRRRAQLEPHLAGADRERAQRVLLHLDEARDCLLDARKRSRYDAKLKSFAQAVPPSVAPQSSGLGWVWLAIPAGVAILLLGIGIGFGVMRLLMPSAPVVNSIPARPELAQLPAERSKASADRGQSASVHAPAEAESADTEPRAAAMPDDPPETSEPAKPESEEPELESVASTSDPQPPPEEEVPATFAFSALPEPDITDRAARLEYVAQVRAMLDAGLAKTPNREKARSHYEKAVAIHARDPRLYYGYALIVHTIQHEEAAKQLGLALKQGVFAYPPAWRLMIDLELKKSLDQRLVKALPGFALRLEQTEGPWPDEGAKAEFALYLGRVIGFCQGPSSAAKRLEADLAEADREIAETLAPSHRQAYELGKADVESQAGFIQGESQRKSEQATAVAKEQQGKSDRQLDSKKRDLTDDEEKLQLKKDEYEARWNKLKSEFQRDWASLEGEYTTMMERAQVIQSTGREINARLRGIDSAIAEALRPYNMGIPEIIRRSLVGPLEEERAQLQAAWSLLDIELRNLRNQVVVVQLRAQASLREIALVETEYQRATGQLVTESTFIAEKRKTLEKNADRIAKERAPKSKAAGSPAELRRFSTYAPLDLAAEKKRLIDSYAERQ